MRLECNEIQVDRYIQVERAHWLGTVLGEETMEEL
jgi:hypothetical protein